eukprot:COSAG02_NODE_6427_length_3576_cov_1.716422_2_plen_137_part_00
MLKIFSHQTSKSKTTCCSCAGVSSSGHKTQIVAPVHACVEGYSTNALSTGSTRSGTTRSPMTVGSLTHCGRTSGRRGGKFQAKWTSASSELPCFGASKVKCQSDFAKAKLLPKTRTSKLFYASSGMVGRHWVVWRR